jgi:hypothetical protein
MMKVFHSFLHKTKETQINIIMETISVICHCVIITSPGPVELQVADFCIERMDHWMLQLGSPSSAAPALPNSISPSQLSYCLYFKLYNSPDDSGFISLVRPRKTNV